jgi:hypothetical protein
MGERQVFGKNRIALAFSFLFLSVVCAGVLLAGRAYAADEAQWTLFADDNGKAGEQLESFLPSDHVQWFRTDLPVTVTKGQKVNWVITAVDTTGGKNVKVTETEKVAEKDTNDVGMNVSLPKDWPIGEYRVDLSIDGKQVSSFDYAIESEEEGDSE